MRKLILLRTQDRRRSQMSLLIVTGATALCGLATSSARASIRRATTSPTLANIGFGRRPATNGGIRYGNDLLLVNTRNSRVLQVVHNHY